MSTSPLSSEEIRAAAETHRELGPEYRDAVVESFLAQVEKVIEARVDALLADRTQPPRRPVDPAVLAKRRLALKHMALGSVGAAIPLSLILFAVNPYNSSGMREAAVLIWVLAAAVYAVASALLLEPWRREHE